MSIERLPHKYPIGCTVRVGWRIGTILFRIGLCHLIIWEKKEPTQKVGSFLIFGKNFVIIIIEEMRKENFLMTLEVLAVILEFYMNQDSCKNCPMAQFCQKMPCEW